MPALTDIKLFLLDMDGTFYLGDTLLPGALRFLQVCRQLGVGHLFLTNNSSKSPQDYLAKLRRLKVPVADGDVFTSGDATLLYMAQQHFPQDILLVGTPSLHAQFAAAGYHTTAPQPKAVVLGFDTGATYQTLTDLCNAVRAGLPYLATHPDFNCPVPGGAIPDVGAFIAFVQASCGRLPDAVIGKPNHHIADAAAARVGLPKQALCMVGDRLYTDIALGEAGVHTALVLSGETTRADLAQSAIRPGWVFENLGELADALLKEAGRL